MSFSAPAPGDGRPPGSRFREQSSGGTCLTGGKLIGLWPRSVGLAARTPSALPVSSSGLANSPPPS